MGRKVAVDITAKYHQSPALLALNADDDTTLVIATHDPAIAERCQHVIRMRDGRITSQPPVSVDDDAPAANRA
jgi:predicted ABC-type transport system involved in lysophospholipase L1 biosynthesis ATPase subunit